MTSGRLAAGNFANSLVFASQSEKALFNGKDVSSSATERIDDYREIEQSDTCPE